MSTSKTEISFEDIYSNLRTVDERAAVYIGIETLIDTLFRSRGKDIIEIIDTEMPHAIVKPLKQQLATLASTSPDSIKQYLESFHDALQQMQIISIEIAFPPAEETLAILIAWIRKNMSNTIIMDISIDRTLLGGARISFEGHYKAFDLMLFVEHAIEQQRDSIQQILYE
jgi:F0F1-type ATP synthase delta subunit